MRRYEAAACIKSLSLSLSCCVCMCVCMYIYILLYMAFNIVNDIISKRYEAATFSVGNILAAYDSDKMVSQSSI